ncbi:hypothetical protein D5R81_01580 [Parashewanella spongiae]|uniref:Uncharacterized protein n=1 Tax=Parashewanella spongiae TaxID=342950 RepID=A0A3A6U170_9GAMM|nr:hypothetical protein [Parashewanella spongiae]MCL1076821.1 hypothetical protein [Parashewanella spongiae]RJY19190.1 hypothetical protein D5R81_01580 [Parashewanella spongiae]
MNTISLLSYSQIRSSNMLTAPKAIPSTLQDSKQIIQVQPSDEKMPAIADNRSAMISIERWEKSTIQFDSQSPENKKAISAYLITQHTVERETIRNSIGIDTYA